jgi:hypothetical protein
MACPAQLVLVTSCPFHPLPRFDADAVCSPTSQRCAREISFRTAQPASSSDAAHSPRSLSAQPCRISAPTPSTTSSSSTLHATPLAALARSLRVTASAAARGLCSGGTSAGTAALPHYSARQARAELVRSLPHKSADTCVPPSSPPTARIAPYTTRSCCLASERRRASRSASKPCAATASRCWERSRSTPRRGQRRRVSATAHAGGAARRCPWSGGRTQSTSVCWPV